jgi:hypothetical protein
VFKSRRRRWEGHIARKGDWRGAYRDLVGVHEGKRPLGNLNVDGRIILKWIFQEVRWRYGLDRSGAGQGLVAGCCERGNEPSSSVKCGICKIKEDTKMNLNKCPMKLWANLSEHAKKSRVFMNTTMSFAVNKT